MCATPDTERPQAPGAPGGARPSRGQLLAEISTAIVAIVRVHYGRGPMMAKTYALDDVIVVVLRAGGYTPLEQTIMDAGGSSRVLALRHGFQRDMAEAFKDTIKRVTGRTVLAFLHQAHIDPDITVQIFVIDGPLHDSDAQSHIRSPE